jgi:hypothetical protein
MEGRFADDDTARRWHAALLGRALVLAHHVQPLDDQPVLAREHLADNARLPPVLAGDDHHRIVAPDLSHT